MGRAQTIEVKHGVYVDEWKSRARYLYRMLKRTFLLSVEVSSTTTLSPMPQHLKRSNNNLMTISTRSIFFFISAPSGPARLLGDARTGYAWEGDDRRTVGDYSPSAWPSDTSPSEIILILKNYIVMRHHSCSPRPSYTLTALDGLQIAVRPHPVLLAVTFSPPDPQTVGSTGFFCFSFFCSVRSRTEESNHAGKNFYGWGKG